jgi:hypothetical protein
MDTHELAVTTADTLRLSEESINEIQAQVEQPVRATESLPREENMDTRVAESRHDSQADAGEVLLDLGEIEAVGEASDDFVLELDDDLSEVAAPSARAAVYEAAPAYEPAAAFETTPGYEPAPPRAFVEPQISETPSYSSEVHDSFADTQEITYAAVAPEPQPQPQSAPESVSAVSSASAAVIPGELSPEMIDAIARRAVELMSDKVIREIAWEVVPDLAELLIKKQLEKTK